ncbi:uncharacterized protein UTRI_03321_B [Ustilago trichophora]|uniref:Uncharacterized protein n=1 Tax=Ustilago trichophora TaxID=86804 RepID=A0A5C3E4T5_9BASI|nr:uncharacterized protein UTRI_03321_B [Ustilago trichophora]
MRLFLLFYLALVVFLSWIRLADAMGSSSDEGMGFLLSNDDADEDEFASRSSHRGHFIDTDTAAHLRDSQLLEPHRAPPPPERFPMPHPALGLLRPVSARRSGAKVKAEPSSSEVARDPNGPQPHPALRAMRFQDAEKAIKRGRVRRIMDEDGGTSGVSEPHTSPVRQREATRRGRRMRSLRELEAGDNAERMEDEEMGMLRARERHRRPDTRSFFADQLSSSPSPPSSAAEPFPPPSPLPPRNLFPSESPRAPHNPPPLPPRNLLPSESPRAPHNPPPSTWIVAKHNNILDGVPVGEPGTASVALRSSMQPPEAMIPRFFQSYNPASHMLPGFRVGGLRYGEIPSLPRLPEPPRQLPPGAGSARVLIPEEILYRYPRAQDRERAYAIALENAPNPMARLALASEAKRLYHEEEAQIRKRIDEKGELPLYTSDEWRKFVSEQGSGALLEHHVPRTTNIGLEADIIQAEHRLANAIHPVNLQQQAVIPLHSRHEQTVAHYLVTRWIAGHELTLDEVVRRAL